MTEQRFTDIVGECGMGKWVDQLLIDCVKPLSEVSEEELRDNLHGYAWCMLRYDLPLAVANYIAVVRQ